MMSAQILECLDELVSGASANVWEREEDSDRTGGSIAVLHWLPAGADYNPRTIAPIERILENFPQTCAS